MDPTPRLRPTRGVDDAGNPPPGFPRIFPYLDDEDTDAMLTWLADAFGLVERQRINGPDGKAQHAAMNAHCERARTAGAEIIEEPHDTPYGDRRYDACDPEGHRWYFASRVREG